MAFEPQEHFLKNAFLSATEGIVWEVKDTVSC